MESIPIRKFQKNSVLNEVSKNIKASNINELAKGSSLSIPLQRIDFFFLLIIKKGHGTHQVDFTYYDIEKHLIFLISPGQVHSLELSELTEGYIIEFSPNLICLIEGMKPLLSNIRTQSLFKFNKHDFARLSPLVTALVKEFNDKHLFYEKNISSYLKLIFVELCRLSPTQYQPNANPYQLERLKEFQELLENNIAESRKVCKYAEMMSITPHQLNRITKTTLNKTCSDLINEQVIIESKKQLLFTSNQVSQIAHMLGYEDVSYFIRFFKKHVGQSPSQFKKNSNKSYLESQLSYQSN